jgi:hypothetical protein
MTPGTSPAIIKSLSFPRAIPNFLKVPRGLPVKAHLFLNLTGLEFFGSDANLARASIFCSIVDFELLKFHLTQLF